MPVTPFITWITRPCSRTIVYRRVSGRLRINSIPHSVIALAGSGRDGSFGLHNYGGSASLKDLGVLAHGVDIGHNVLKKSLRCRYNLSCRRIERKASGNEHSNRATIVWEVVIH